MNIKSKSGLAKQIQIILLILTTLVFFYGFPIAKEAGEERKIQKAAEKIELIVTDKINESKSYRSLEYDLLCTIKNDSDVTFDAISGIFKIMDLDGNVLSEGEAKFSGDLEGKSEKKYKLTWTSEITDKNMKAFESDFSNLKFSYEIKEITYNGFETVEIKK